jgi:hypothetical protein
VGEPVRILLNEAQIEHIVAGRRTFLVAGICLLALPFFLPTGWGFGLTGFMVLCLGILASAVSAWRTEPGLWMLAMFLTLVLGGSWGYFEFLSLQGIFAEPGPRLVQQKMTWEQVGFATDSGVALPLFGWVARFVASVAIANWARTSTLAQNA